jgi:hypothetical protein
MPYTEWDNEAGS